MYNENPFQGVTSNLRETKICSRVTVEPIQANALIARNMHCKRHPVLGAVSNVGKRFVSKCGVKHVASGTAFAKRSSGECVFKENIQWQAPKCYTICRWYSLNSLRFLCNDITHTLVIGVAVHLPETRYDPCSLHSILVHTFGCSDTLATQTHRQYDEWLAADRLRWKAIVPMSKKAYVSLISAYSCLIFFVALGSLHLICAMVKNSDSLTEGWSWT